MEKTYNFQIKHESFKVGSSIIEQIKEEAERNRTQLALTTKINKETTKVHRQILEDFWENFKEQLTLLGYDGDLDRCAIEKTIQGTNSYYGSFVRVPYLFDRSVIFSIGGQSDRDFTDSKYCTYTGDFTIKLQYGIDFAPSHSGTVLKNGVESALELLRDKIVAYLTKKAA